MGAKHLLWFLLLRCGVLFHTVVADESKKEVLVKEVVLDSAVVDIVYLGKNHECVLVTTKNKRLYFSGDSGRTWAETTEQVDKNSNAQIQVERVIVNPTDKSVAVLQTQRRLRSSSDTAAEVGGKWYPYIYVTEDSGKTWRRAWGKHHGLHSWISHPTERTWALVSWWSGDCSADKVKKIEKGSEEEDEEAEEEKKPCVHRLMVTKDLGKNFLQIAEYVVQFSWGSVEADQANRVYFTAYRTKSGDQGRLSLWTAEVDFKYIEFSKRGTPKGSPVESVKFGNKFLVSGQFILVAKVKEESAQTVNLMVSKDGAKTFKPALLPSGMGELEEKWYTVLDTSEGAVILHINSDAEGAKDTGRIFISDMAGHKYSQSLINNVRSSHGECEFDKVVSLNGVYMANIVVPDGSAEQSYSKARQAAQEEMEKEAAGGAEVDQKHGRGMSKLKSSKASKEERTIRTVISFDKGGAWNYLKAPRMSSVGKPYDCEGKPSGECALHLHGTTSWDFYAPFYSSESCIGIVMGTGNVGASLRFEPEETATFISRDGGLTWLEAHKGAFIYEFGDHGGLIVMADDLKMTSEVLFTWNEGQSWYDFKVSKTPFEVDNIITEPNVTATTFIMFGTRAEGVGVLYYMNFDALGFPACKGVWGADAVSSDYETWMPSDGASSESCLLGQQTTYTRRKRTSQCWNGERFERPVVQKKCACTQANFACEIGFVRSVGSTECVYGGAELMPERFVPASCDRIFSANAYRKVPGDQCEGGFQPTLVEVACPSKPIHSGYMKSGLLVALVVVVAYIAYTRFSSGSGTTFEMSASKSVFADCSPMLVLQVPIIACSWLYGKFCVKHRGFEAFPTMGYSRVKGDDFDLDGIAGDGQVSLNDFIDEAAYDDHAPRVIDGAAAADSSYESSTSFVSGGLSTASGEVPKLKGPLGGSAAQPSAQIFDMAGEDQDLL